MLTERSGRIVAAHRLLRRSRRAQTGQFLAEGRQVVAEAIAYARLHPGAVRELYVTEAAAKRHVHVVRSAFAAGVAVTQVTDRAAAKLTDAVTPQGLVARCLVLDTDPVRLLDPAPRLLAVLVETGDPGNLGTVVRVADAAGADGVLLVGSAVDPFNPKAVRATAGSLFHLPVARMQEPSEVVRWLDGHGLITLATTAGAGVDLHDAARDGLLDSPTAWLFGSEAHGLPDLLVEGSDEAIRVPIYGQAESLNLAAAAAVCLYASAAAHRSG